MPLNAAAASTSPHLKAGSSSGGGGGGGNAAAAGGGAARRGGRRDQQDLNHLLGFTLPPRPPPPAPTHLPRRSARRSAHSGAGGGHHAHQSAAWGRERFVHQHRFVVQPGKDYTVHFADPDIHLDWSDILQVILPVGGSAIASVTTHRVDQGGEEHGKPACPICLSEPTAARMTKCGHVFCYPCVLHYLALADPGQKERKCPVCHDFIHAKDLKSVKWFTPSGVSTKPPSPHPSAPPGEPIDADLARALELSKLDAHPRSASSAQQSSSSGETLKMRLIRRPQLTTLALPRSSTWPSDAVQSLRAPWQFTPDAFTYAKFMLGAPDYMRDELSAEKRELEREIQTLRRFGVRGGTDEELGIVFVEAALSKVDEQLAKVELLKTTSVMTARKKALRELQEVQDRAGAVDGADRLPPVTDTSASELEADEPARKTALPPPVPPVHDPIPIDFLHSRGGTPLSSTAQPFVPASTSSAPPSSPPQVARARPNQRKNVLPPQQQASEDPAYYFYQAASGQPIFLQPLDIRILKSHFGTYQAMPDTIEVAVEGADEGSMNDELRRRCKWLSHLPLASELVFVEADLSRVVSRKALEPYAAALKQRRTKRREKARKEDRAKLRSEQAARDALPVFESTYAHGATAPHAGAGGLPWGFAASDSSWDDAHAFPAPPGSSPPSSATAAAAAASPARPPPAARPSFASALHASSRSASAAQHASAQSAWDDEFEDRWGEFEEQLGRQRVAAGATSPRGRSGTATPAAAGGGGGAAPGTPAGANVNVSEGGGQGKKGRNKGKKLVLNLSGSALRGTG
ncbi:RING-type E3 ubiquitin transferase MAG2 [Rhodotorula paludigena]|uniref:RING-type E3 ubiquitin transferase MAG2 n=1 Tax=Rhodotorula paludigena TaxID=86838 RepID=UPI0031807228